MKSAQVHFLFVHFPKVLRRYSLTLYTSYFKRKNSHLQYIPQKASFKNK